MTKEVYTVKIETNDGKSWCSQHSFSSNYLLTAKGTPKERAVQALESLLDNMKKEISEGNLD